MTKTKIKSTSIKKLEQVANALELIGIIAVLIMTLLFQFALNELPCPLCLLQRFGYFGIAFGFLLNLRFGFRPSHYAIVLLSGVFTCFVALRQIALHILPGMGSYGDALFGLHLYTWSFIVAVLIIISTCLLLAVDRQYSVSRYEGKRWYHWTRGMFICVAAIVFINIVSVVFECGFKVCPDNPVSYELFKILDNKFI